MMTSFSQTQSSAQPTGLDDVDALLSGYEWTGATVTYALTDSLFDYNGGSCEANYGFEGSTDQMKLAAKTALDLDFGNAANDGFSIEGFTNLNIRTSSHSSADVRIAQSDAPSAAWAYYPSNDPIGDDLWFGKSYDYTDPQADYYAWHTMFHELGHAFGLKHRLETDSYGSIPSNKDSLEFSIMTYLTFVGDDVSGYKYKQYGAPQSFMRADIHALQEMYGADFEINSGNTVYRWTPGSGDTIVNGEVAIASGGNRIFATIWDGGGIVSYDLLAYSTNLNIDLRAGSGSIFDLAQTAYLGGELNGGQVQTSTMPISTMETFAL